MQTARPQDTGGARTALPAALPDARHLVKIGPYALSHVEQVVSDRAFRYHGWGREPVLRRPRQPGPYAAAVILQPGGRGDRRDQETSDDHGSRHPDRRPARR